VFINGLGPFRLVLDTGANHTTISPALATRLGLVPQVDSELLLHGVTGAELVPAVIVDRLQAGDLIVEAVRVPVVATDIMAGADGILGVAGLTRERISVNFRADRITIARSKGFPPTSGLLRIPAARVAGGLLMVEARVGGVRVRGVIDTGAEHSLGNLPLQEALKKRRRLQPPRSTSVFGTTTAISDGQLSGVPDIKLGTATISQMNLVFGDFHIFKVWALADEPAMLIGMDVLGTVSELIIDFKLRTVYVVA
jgi:predicted aspartyl protease